MPCGYCTRFKCDQIKKCNVKHNKTTCVFNPESRVYVHPDNYPLIENAYLEMWGLPRHALWWGYQERAKQRQEAKKPVAVSEDDCELLCE